MSESSRKGRTISRKACDLCRERKIQCVFNHDLSTTICQKCMKAEVPCTFLTDRKPRGPPSRRVAEARQRAAGFEPASESPATSTSTALSLPSPGNAGPLQFSLVQLTIAHFVPEHTLSIILDDFFDRIYPVLPIVHAPTFTRALAERRHDSDPAFFRLCIALCAVTIASIPRRQSVYGMPWYKDVGEMVDRASQLIVMSRLATDPLWRKNPTLDSAIISVIMGLATHYAGWPHQGWAYVSEAILYFRYEELHHKEAYSRFGPVEAEMCKRTFWIVFIMQVHDRLATVNPHLGLHYDLTRTDWEFLMPLEISDEDLDSLDHSSPPYTRPPGVPLPLVSGFTNLIKVFVLMSDVLHKAFPGAPSEYNMSPGNVGQRLLQDYCSPRPQLQGSIPSLETLFHSMTRLNAILADLPEELLMPRRRGSPRMQEAVTADPPQVSPQFGIMRANVHITSIYLQSMILEVCLGELERSSRETRQSTGGSVPSGGQAWSPGESDATTYKNSAREQLWRFKEAVARELLDVIHHHSAWTLESNGRSMIVKIRETAATLLERSAGSEMSSEAENRAREYVAQFVEILANLDYAQRARVGT